MTDVLDRRTKPCSQALSALLPADRLQAGVAMALLENVFDPRTGSVAAAAISSATFFFFSAAWAARPMNLHTAIARSCNTYSTHGSAYRLDKIAPWHAAWDWARIRSPVVSQAMAPCPTARGSAAPASTPKAILMPDWTQSERSSVDRRIRHPQSAPARHHGRLHRIGKKVGRADGRRRPEPEPCLMRRNLSPRCDRE